MSTFTPSQVLGHSSIQSFLMGNDRKFILTGAPGTGKTFLVKSILDQLQGMRTTYRVVRNKEFPIANVVLTATTHPAAEELAKSTGEIVKTVHSALGIVPTRDMLTGEEGYEFKENDNQKDFSNTLIIIDEASMLVRSFYDLIDKIMMPSTKVIFVMDADQLIMPDPKSKYPLEFFDEDVPPYCRVELIEQMRINNPDIAELVEDYREVVRGDEFFYLEEIVDSLDVIQDEDELRSLIMEMSQDTPGANKFVAYTNSAVTSFNTLVRNTLQLPKHLTVGETVLMNRTLLDLQNNIIFANGTVLEIVECLGMENRQLPCKMPLTLVKYRVRVHNDPRPTNVPRKIEVLHDYRQYRKIAYFLEKNGQWSDLEFITKCIGDIRMHGGVTGSTIFKSQGASYNTLILNASNLESVFDDDLAARALYVTMSRARERLFLYGKLPKRFGGSD